MEDLYRDGLASEKELAEAKAEHRRAIAEQHKTSQVLHINSSGAQSAYLVKSPVNGFVVEKHLTENMRIRPDNNDLIFSVADLSTVWAVANIFESDISKAKEGSPASIYTLSYPDKKFQGKINRIANIIDPENKALQARIIIGNSGNLLKPGMFTTVTISDTSLQQFPVIPTACVVFDNNRHYVLRITKDNKPEIQEIDIEKTVNGITYIKNGLQPGERVIRSRKLFLYEALKETSAGL